MFTAKGVANHWNWRWSIVSSDSFFLGSWMLNESVVSVEDVWGDFA
jgi:hypothetical protein